MTGSEYRGTANSLERDVNVTSLIISWWHIATRFCLIVNILKHTSQLIRGLVSVFFFLPSPFLNTFHLLVERPPSFFPFSISSSLTMSRLSHFRMGKLATVFTHKHHSRAADSCKSFLPSIIHLRIIFAPPSHTAPLPLDHAWYHTSSFF